MVNGGSIAYFASDGGEPESQCNFNFLLEEFGMMIHSDGVVQTNLVEGRYYHPKEALVEHGVLNRGLNSKGKKMYVLKAEV